MESYSKGRKMIIGVIAYYILVEVVGIVLNIWMSSPIEVSDIIRLGLTFFVSYALYNKKNWARIAIIVFAVLGVFASVTATMLLIPLTQLALVFVLFAIVYVVVIVLMTNKHVKAYINSPDLVE